jgi:hypothetical protein
MPAILAAHVCGYSNADTAKVLEETHSENRYNALFFIPFSFQGGMGSNAYVTQNGLRLDIKNMPPCTIFGQPWYKLAGRFMENTDPENPNMITITGVPSQQELDSPLPQSAIVRLLAVCCVNEAIQSRAVEGRTSFW